MRFDELQIELLKARDLRQKRLDEVLGLTDNTLIQMSLNVPGANKCPARGEPLLLWGDEQLRGMFSRLLQVHCQADLLGPWAIYMTASAAIETKMRCCAIEEKTTFSRLLDLDVFSSTGQCVGRQQLNLEQRKCIVCQEDAKECMRTKRHDRTMINETLQQLLNSVPY